MIPIPYNQLHGLTARDITRALERSGFHLVRQRGSHHRYKDNHGHNVTVDYSSLGDTFVTGLLKSMITQAGWTENDLVRLGFLK